MGVRAGKYKLEVRAGKYKFGARADKYKFGARTGKYKLGARAGKYKFGARASAGGQAKGRGPGNTNTRYNTKSAIYYFLYEDKYIVRFSYPH